LTDETARENF
jgi:translocation protein SEC63